MSLFLIETDIVTPVRAVEYVTDVLTSTLVRDEWVAPQTSTAIHTNLHYDIYSTAPVPNMTLMLLPATSRITSS